MADRNFDKVQALQKGTKTLYGSYTVSALGAVTAVTPKKGWTSVAKSATGTHTITLDDKYYSLLFAKAIVVQDSAGAAPIVQIKAETVATTKTVVFIFLDAAGAAADPASCTVLFEVALANSGV